MEPGRETQRIGWLDGLRAVAILLVIARHVYDRPLTWVFAGISDPSTPKSAPLLVADFGWVGVYLFFIISGFLVGGGALLSAEAGRFRVTHFLKRRFIRVLVPALIFLLAHRLMVEGNFGFSQPDFLHNVLFLTNYTIDGWESHYWTLCVEAHVYIAIALATGLVASVSKIDRRRAGVALLALAVLFAAIKLVATLTGHDTRFYLYTHWQLEYFLAGAAVRLLWMPTLTDNFVPILSSAPMQFIGRISFSLYLVHLAVIEHFPRGLIFKVKKLEPLLAYSILLTVLTAACIVAAYIFFRIVESPAAKMADMVSVRGRTTPPAPVRT